MNASGGDHPTVFISYCHESQENLDRVLELSDRLRADGIDCYIDQYETAPNGGWRQWTVDQFQRAEFVLVICTEEFHARYHDENRRSGVGFEGTIISRELYKKEFKNCRFHPVLFSPDDVRHIPEDLDDFHRFVLTDDDGYERLYRHLTNQPFVKMPPLGSIKEMPERKRETAFDVGETKKETIATPIKEGKPIKSLPKKKLKSITIDLPGLPEGAKPLEMVLILAGTFLMGIPDDEKGRRENEGLQHEVTISKDFYLGKYPVTQAQWEAVMGKYPSYFSGKPNHPVECVSWDDCQKYIEKLNGIKQGTFSLPTEAQWEYACRAGTKTRFYWGGDPGEEEIDRYAWFDGNNKPNGTKEVGLKLPNSWGLYDMSGNVWEWCQDWYGDYPKSAQVDPNGQESGDTRVLRGGCYNYIATSCRSAIRGYNYPYVRSDYDGFRVVRTP